MTADYFKGGLETVTIDVVAGERHLEPRVARLEGELEQLVASVSALTRSMDVFHRDIAAKVDSISRDTRPDFGLLAQWTGVAFTVIALVAAPVAYHFNKSIVDLEVKLQKEYALIHASVNERLTALQRQFETQQKRSEDWLSDQVKSDLDELRARRLKDAALK